MITFNDFVQKYNLKKSNVKYKNSKSPDFYWIGQCQYLSKRRTVFKRYRNSQFTPFKGNALGLLF